MAQTKPLPATDGEVPPGQAEVESPERQPVVWKGVFISDQRIVLLQERISARIEPTFSAFQKAKADADANLQRQPQAPDEWYVPGYYKDPEGHRNARMQLQNDANAAYALALVYRLTGEVKYAEAAVRLIDGWTSTLKTLSSQDDSQLSFSYHFPAFVFAAGLLHPYCGWNADSKKTFEDFLRQKALPMHTMQRTNNWGNWGLVLFASIAAYSLDEHALRTAQTKWRSFIEGQMDEQEVLLHEVSRGKPEGNRGLWYSHFSLMPQTLAAEILRLNGLDEYEYTSASGRSLKLAHEKLVPWVANPASFPYYKGADPNGHLGPGYVSYWEILQNKWPNETAAAILAKQRPATAIHSAPYLTLTHGGMPSHF